jgi:hypothetical protein
MTLTYIYASWNFTSLYQCITRKCVSKDELIYTSNVQGLKLFPHFTPFSVENISHMQEALGEKARRTHEIPRSRAGGI